MKRFTIRVSALLSRLCAATLVFFGFGCSSDDSDDYICMYGTPTGSFEVKGKVVDENGAPVEGAGIIVTASKVPSSLYKYAEGKSNAEGNFEVSGRNGFVKELKVVCVPKDKQLDADSIVVEPKYNKSESKSNPWYVGHADVNIDFKLKEKKTQE